MLESLPVNPEVASLSRHKSPSTARFLLPTLLSIASGSIDCRTAHQQHQHPLSQQVSGAFLPERLKPLSRNPTRLPCVGDTVFLPGYARDIIVLSRLPALT